MTDACFPRNPLDLLGAVAALRVETNPIYAPDHLVAGTTWCNLFIADVTRALGCPIPFVRANQQAEYLAGLDGARDGWLELTGPTRHIIGIDQAERGFPTVAVWSYEKGHGHIAILVPGEPGKMCVAQAGSSNFSSGPIARGFGKLPFRLFTHV